MNPIGTNQNYYDVLYFSDSDDDGGHASVQSSDLPAIPVDRFSMLLGKADRRHDPCYLVKMVKTHSVTAEQAAELNDSVRRILGHWEG